MVTTVLVVLMILALLEIVLLNGARLFFMIVWLTNPEYVQQLAGYPLTGAPSAVQFIEMLYNALVRAV